MAVTSTFRHETAQQIIHDLIEGGVPMGDLLVLAGAALAVHSYGEMLHCKKEGLTGEQPAQVVRVGHGERLEVVRHCAALAANILAGTYGDRYEDEVNIAVEDQGDGRYYVQIEGKKPNPGRGGFDPLLN